MVRLEDLALFVRTAALGSFSAAAREADLLPGQASAAVQRLERALDVRLFARSTRSLRLTADGERYLPYAQGVLDTLREGQEQLQGERAALQGVLQISAPSDLGRNVLLPWLAEFRRLHPGLTLRLLVSDQVADVFRDPVDVAIRYGNMRDASYVALPLVPDNRRVLVAAPAYLAHRGRPRTLDELSDHDCLTYMMNGRPYDKWVFEEAGRRRTVAVSGSMMTDDADVVRRLGVAGEGLVYKSALDVADDVAAGRLVRITLKGVLGEPTPLNMVSPHRRQFSAAVRALHAWLSAKLNGEHSAVG